MLTRKPRYRRLRVIRHIEVIEWFSVEDCLKELAELNVQRRLQKAERKRLRAKMRSVLKREREMFEVVKLLSRTEK